MANFLLLGFLLTGCVLFVQGLVCHHCTGVSHPRHCTKIKTCNASELCFTERIMSKNKIMFHNSGCTSKQVCNGENGVPCNGLRQCVSYCSTNRCNKNPCHSAGYKRSCKEYKKLGVSSGVYTLDLGDLDLPLIRVYCDMDTAGGGWTVFQRRKDGSENFYRVWSAYKNGFGNLHREFWLGNDNLHRLTKAGLTTLRVDLTDWAHHSRHAQYSTFRVGPASNYYRLTVGGYSGNAGDSLRYHNGMAFSTKDSDHDQKNYSCSQKYSGAWWYNNCYLSSLNGLYFNTSSAPKSNGISWNGWKGSTYSLKFSEMKIREP